MKSNIVMAFVTFLTVGYVFGMQGNKRMLLGRSQSCPSFGELYRNNTSLLGNQVIVKSVSDFKSQYSVLREKERLKKIWYREKVPTPPYCESDSDDKSSYIESYNAEELSNKQTLIEAEKVFKKQGRQDSSEDDTRNNYSSDDY